jgi:16S rRNA (guanine966-N2)-methyltransferase
VSPSGRPKGERRRAQRDGSTVHPPGRPKGERRSAQREGSPPDAQADRVHASRGANAGSRRPSAKLPHQVRIIGGQWKRTKLPVADKPGLRPTPDRVRETLFNWLGQDLSGWRVLDAFAGSGALGFEAASRGAAEAVLLEHDGEIAVALRELRRRLQAQAVRVETTDALAWMARCEAARFDLVLLDPPFGRGLPAGLLDAAARLVAPGGWLYLEASVRCMACPAGFELHRHTTVGAVHAHLLHRTG